MSNGKVVSYRGTWIETLPLIILLLLIRSYLIEVRGLKLLSVNKRAAPPVVSYRGTWIETEINEIAR